jgi:dihydrolipoamide dehydrogenase
MRTAVAERATVGGRCLTEACIPAKAVLRAADVLSEVRRAGEFGVRLGESGVDFARVMARRDTIVGSIAGGVRGLLDRAGVAVIEGEARLLGRGRVAVAGRELAPARVILATGSVPHPLPGIPFGGRVVDTARAWALKELPGRIAVIGAGASGVEIASAYARLGSQVLLVEAAERILPGEDADAAAHVARGLRKDGVSVLTGEPVADVRSGEAEVAFRCGGEDRHADWLVVATGRRADTAGLGLAEAGVEVEPTGLVRVDGAQRTSAPAVWAIGDLVAGPALAHKASEEGVIAAEDAAGLATTPLRHDDIPRATFCSPGLASVGLSEDAARAAGHDVVVGTVRYGAVGAGTVYGDRSGLVKIVGDRRTGEVLGACIAGSRSAEMIHELALARAQELGYPEIARLVHAHPTLSEAVLEAARVADGWLIHG